MPNETKEMIRRQEEETAARSAIYHLRKKSLIAEIDSLVFRASDCDALIAQGKYNHEQAFNFLKVQVQRVSDASAVLQLPVGGTHP